MQSTRHNKLLSERRAVSALPGQRRRTGGLAQSGPGARLSSAPSGKSSRSLPLSSSSNSAVFNDWLSRTSSAVSVRSMRTSSHCYSTNSSSRAGEAWDERHSCSRPTRARYVWMSIDYDYMIVQVCNQCLAAAFFGKRHVLFKVNSQTIRKLLRKGRHSVSINININIIIIMLVPIIVVCAESVMLTNNARRYLNLLASTTDHECTPTHIHTPTYNNTYIHTHTHTHTHNVVHSALRCKSLSASNIR